MRNRVALGMLAALVLAGGIAACGHDRTKSAPAATDAKSGAVPRKELWLCPMHPTYVSDHKGTCPICGMDLVPAAEFEAAAGAGASGIPGMASVTLSDDAIRLAGVRTTPAVVGSLAGAIRTVGIVTADEARIRHVHTKVSGWVEKLLVNTVGEQVRRGDPILALYSPELLAVQEELLQARTAAASATTEEARRAAESLAAAARQRIRLLDVPEEFIGSVEQTGQASRVVPLRAPFSGVVTTLNVLAGHAVSPEMELYTLTDLSQVWIEGSFYEGDARALRLGESAELTLPYDASVALNGTIDFIAPSVDPVSRTIQVRFVFANDFGLLKPGMYVNISLASDQEESVLVPDNAILDTGERSIVFVALGEGVFAPREVEVGARAGGRAQILSGVEAGEQVVVKANFLLDSESRIRAALSGASAPAAGSSNTPATAPADGNSAPVGHQHGGM